MSNTFPYPTLLEDTDIPDEHRAKALAYLARNDALDLAPVLLGEEV